MTAKLAFEYDHETKEYKGMVECGYDPLESELAGEDVWIVPADATLVAPPDAKKGVAYVWNGTAWEEIEDNRGQEFWWKEGSYNEEPEIMNELGPLPKGAVTTKPPKSKEYMEHETRRRRNGLLKGTDKFMLMDFPISEAERQLYLAYREYLRNYTDSENWWEKEPLTFEEWNEVYHG